jgi:predicted TPR repeat methyltransferase
MKLGAGSLLHTQIMQYATAAYGLDIARTSIEFLQAQGIPNLFVGDVESFDPSQAGTGFDLIVAGEIIEHLSNPGQFLNAVTQHMGERTELILTTPNAYCLVRSAIYAVLGRDPVHPDHNYWYSRATLTSLLSKHGLVVTEFLFYPINGKLAGYTVPWYMSLTDWLAKHWLPHLNDGLIAVCRKAQVDSSSPLPGGAGQ